MVDNVIPRPAAEADYRFGCQVRKAALGHYIADTWGWNEDQQRDSYRREFSLD